MPELLVHPLTQQHIADYVQRPAHALGIFGPNGVGTDQVLQAIASQIMDAPIDKLYEQPYILRIASEDGKAIGIEAVRSLEKFLQLKVPGRATYNRIIMVEDGHLLGIEAQNSLLKTLEEPPAGTLILLSATREDALLATIRSRLQALHVKAPTKDQLTEHFTAQGHDAQAINRVYAMTGGLPTVMQALLSGEDHPLTKATDMARTLVSGTSYDRMLQVELLSKQKDLAQDVLFIMQQMARVRLQSVAGEASKQWQRILQASYQASEALAGNGNAKLVLSDLMLSL